MVALKLTRSVPPALQRQVGGLIPVAAPLQAIIGVSVLAAGLGTREQWPPRLLVIRVITRVLGGVQVKRLM